MAVFLVRALDYTDNGQGIGHGPEPPTQPHKTLRPQLSAKLCFGLRFRNRGPNPDKRGGATRLVRAVLTS